MLIVCAVVWCKINRSRSSGLQFTIYSGSDNYCVIGSPVTHSRSPCIHAAFAKQTGQVLTYSAVEVKPGMAVKAVRKFFAMGGKGMNITIPLKEEALAAVEHPSYRVTTTGSINTVWRSSRGKISADTTDGRGLIRDLENNHGIGIRDLRVLILGAGGSVCGIMPDLLNANPSEVVLANRTAEKARAIAHRFAGSISVVGGGYDELDCQAFDLIINATAASLKGTVPPLSPSVMATPCYCYDLFYSAVPTPFQVWAKEHGAVGSWDGLGMLVEQAAESFFLWRGVRPDTEPVISALRTSGSK